MIAPLVQIRKEKLLALTGLAAFIVYGTLFYLNIAPFWFNPKWTTDDAFQQLFPLHEILHPGIFNGDLIYELMKGYLTPIHYLVSYVVTLFTRDPIMTGHWVMLLQLVPTVLGILFLVRSACRSQGGGSLSGLFPAFAAAIWFLHSRMLVQRLTCGLPRGWAPAIIVWYLYFAIGRRYRLATLTIFLGILLNPPMAFLLAVTHGFILLARAVPIDSRVTSRRAIIEFAICSPLLLITALQVIKRPAEIGKVYSYEEARSVPEFQRDGGRFSYIPFLPAAEELSDYAFRTVHTPKLFGDPEGYKPPAWWVEILRPLFILVVGGLLILGAVRKKEFVPLEITIFGCSALLVYFLARTFAFKLYVPDRHILFPIGLFLITGLTSGFWRLLALDRGAYIRAAVLFALLGVAIFLGTGSGLQAGRKGVANFNRQVGAEGHVFDWVKEHTDENVLIAGYPYFIDPLQLYGVRRAYATSEALQPFYDAYLTEMRRRLEITLRANYALSLNEMVRLLTAEKINYFIFERRQFRPEILAKASYYKPLNTLVRELVAHKPEEFAVRSLPFENKEVVPFVDDRAIVVNVGALSAYLNEKKE